MTLSAVSNRTWLNVEVTLNSWNGVECGMARRRDGGAWVDTTQGELDWHKKTIGMYEGLVRKLRAEHGGETYRERAPTIRLRHTRRAVHGKAQGRTPTAAEVSPLCDVSGGDPVRRRGTSGRARAGRLDAGR